MAYIYYESDPKKDIRLEEFLFYLLPNFHTRLNSCPPLPICLCKHLRLRGKVR